MAFAAAAILVYAAFAVIYLSALLDMFNYFGVKDSGAVGKAIWPLVGLVIGVVLAVMFAFQDAADEFICWAMSIFPIFGAACGMFNALLFERSYQVTLADGSEITKVLAMADCRVLFMIPILCFLLAVLIIVSAVLFFAIAVPKICENVAFNKKMERNHREYERQHAMKEAEKWRPVREMLADTAARRQASAPAKSQEHKSEGRLREEERWAKMREKDHQ